MGASKCEEFRGSPGDLKPWICSEKSALCIHTNNSIWPMLGGILPLTTNDLSRLGRSRRPSAQSVRLSMLCNRALYFSYGNCCHHLDTVTNCLSRNRKWSFSLSQHRYRPIDGGSNQAHPVLTSSGRAATGCLTSAVDRRMPASVSWTFEGSSIRRC